LAPNTIAGLVMKLTPPSAARPAPVLALFFKKSLRLTSDSFDMAGKAPFKKWRDYTPL
jgi:hypothetical protein